MAIGNIRDGIQGIINSDTGSILDDIKDKATKLLKLSEPYITRDTSVYDSSLNRIVVAGLPLDGVVSSTVSADTLTKQESGIDYSYTTYYQSLEQRTLTVQLLPTASCLPLIRLLALEQQTSKGWFNISVHENGTIENVYRAWVINLPELASSKDAENKTIVFGIKPMFAGVSVIDQPTDTEIETYSRYGASPDKAAYDDTMIIHEDTGLGESLDDFDVSTPLPQEDIGVEDDFDPSLPQDDLS